MCRLPSGSSTSAWRTTTRSSRTPRTVSRTQPEMFWPPSSRQHPSPACVRRTGRTAIRRTGGADRGSIRPGSNGTLVAAIQRSVVEARRVPAGLRHAQVDRAAVVQVRRADLGGRRPPAPVRRDDQARPVDALDLELGNQPELPAVAASVVRRVPTEPPAVPPVPEHARRWRSAPASAGASRRRCPPGCGGDRTSSPVPAGRRRPARPFRETPVHAERRHVEAGAGDRRRHVELPPEHRRRRLTAAARVVRERDGTSGPRARLEQARLDPQRVAPARPARDVTHPDAVVAHLPAAQRTPWRGHRDLRVALAARRSWRARSRSRAIRTPRSRSRAARARDGRR